MTFRHIENRQDRMERTMTVNELEMEHGSLYGAHHTPETELEAMMEAVPLQDVPMSAEERESDWSEFQVKLDGAGLTDMERIVVNAMIFGGRSATETGLILAQAKGRNRVYSKTHVQRLQAAGYAKLRKAFQ